VYFARAADLVQSLVAARGERRLTALQQRYQKVGLLIVDELGFVPFERTGGEISQPAGPALRAPLDHHHHESGVLGMGKGVRRRKAHDRAARSP
jgi:hypothetical protein